MRGLAIRVGIIAAIAGGVWVLRPFISGGAGSLAGVADRMVEKLRQLGMPVDAALETMPATTEEDALGRPRCAERSAGRRPKRHRRRRALGRPLLR